VLTLLPYIALTPLPVLAAIVTHAVSHSLNPSIFRPYFAWHRDRLVVFAAILGVLLLGVLHGLLFAIAISLTLMLRRFSESNIVILGRLGDSHNFIDIKIHPEAVPIAGILIVRPDEPLFFANTERILGQIRQAVIADKPHSLIISLEETQDLDSTSIEALRDFFAWVFHADCKLLLARLKHPVHQILQQVVPPGLTAPLFIGLSVDDAVRTVLTGSDDAAEE
jgi:MFS superfamily sulfate permease-like transporter